MSNVFSRRDILTGSLAIAAAGVAPSLRGQTVVEDLVEFRRVVAANRILANEGVVDAFGHVSVRDPRNADRYVMSHSRSPEFVELSDLIVFESDGTKVDPNDGRTPYGERMIHGAIYESRPDVNAVVHHHSYAVVPFSVSDIPLRPVVHVGSVIGAEVPVWDLQTSFGDTDMLVRTMEMGHNLAATLGDNTCLLIRGHGAVATGADVKQAVSASVALQVNAQIQLDSLQLSEEPTYLTDEEIERSRATQFSPLALDRAWEYFCRRAGVDPV
ncbi:MAG: class II aldolase/adducin family protein [Gammaproteobacteria bacterium]